MKKLLLSLAGTFFFIWIVSAQVNPDLIEFQKPVILKANKIKQISAYLHYPESTDDELQFIELYNANGLIASKWFTSGSYLQEDSGYIYFYTFNETDNLIGISTAGMDEVPYDMEYFFDKKGKLKSADYRSPEPRNYKYLHNKSGQIIEAQAFRIPILEGEGDKEFLIEKNFYTYDEAGNLIKNVYHYNPSGDEKFDNETVYRTEEYRYDPAGKIVKGNITYSGNNKEEEIYEYNENKLLVKKTIKTSEGVEKQILYYYQTY